MSDALLHLVDLLVVNGVEAEQLGGRPVDDLESAREAAEGLQQRFPVVVVTAGGDGVAGISGTEPAVVLPALAVRLVSTHGAGDVFVGTLAAALASGMSFLDSLVMANTAAAAHVSRRD